MHDKNIHINKGLGDHYPEPEIPIEDAWAAMQELLEKNDDTIPPAVPLVPPFNKEGGRNFWVLLLLLACLGTGGLVTYVYSGQHQEKADNRNTTGANQSASVNQHRREPDSIPTPHPGLLNNSKKSDSSINQSVIDSEKNSSAKARVLNNTMNHNSNPVLTSPHNKMKVPKIASIKKTGVVDARTDKKNSTYSIVQQKDSVVINRQGTLNSHQTEGLANLPKRRKNYSHAMPSHFRSQLKNQLDSQNIPRIGNHNSLTSSTKNKKHANKIIDARQNARDLMVTNGSPSVSKKRPSFKQKHAPVWGNKNNANQIYIEEPRSTFSSTSKNNPQDENFRTHFIEPRNQQTRMPQGFSVASHFPDSIHENAANPTAKIQGTQHITVSNQINKSTAKRNSGKGLAMAAGLGFNQFFSIGGQQNSGYNSNGTSNTITDYIPVPMVRLYFNKSTYIQLEAQFNTPQFTKNLLAKQVTTIDSTATIPTSSQQSIFIKKLFYFNLPVSFHYSPFNHFYIGAGLQYARLSNGVGLFQNTKLGLGGGADSVYFSKIGSIKTDPVYRELKTSEWRLLVDANYQINNLALGLRYNQALSNFVNILISTNQITQSRNSSLQLYLRYMLWKSKNAKGLIKN